MGNLRHRRRANVAARTWRNEGHAEKERESLVIISARTRRAHPFPRASSDPDNHRLSQRHHPGSTPPRGRALLLREFTRFATNPIALQHLRPRAYSTLARSSLRLADGGSLRFSAGSPGRTLDPVFYPVFTFRLTPTLISRNLL